MSFSLVGEIARKKIELEAAKQQAGIAGGPKKYVRRGDLEKQRGGGGDAAGVDAPGAGVSVDPTGSAVAAVAPAEPKVALKRTEVIARLRKLGQPITLFAETDEARHARLLAFEEEQSGHDRSDVAVAGVYEFRGAGGGASSGHKRLRADSEAGDLASPDEKAGGGFASRTGGSDAGAGDDEDDAGEGAGGAAAARPRVVAADADGWKGKDDHKYVHRFFKGMLNEWEAALAAASDDVRDSAAGRTERRTQKQTRDYMRAFFKMCKMRSLPEDVLRFAVEIVVRMRRSLPGRPRISW